MSGFLLRTFWGYRKVEALGPEIRPDRQINSIGYTLGGLCVMIGLLLVACTGFNLIMVGTGTLLPAQYNALGVSNTVIAIVLTSIPSILNIVINPTSSAISDRTRSRFGRRMPFIIWTTPFIAATLVLIGWSSKLGISLDTLIPALNGNGAYITLVAMGLLFGIFFMIPGAVFWYIFPDVVPKTYMGRFMSFFSLIQAACSVCFGRWLLPLSVNYMEWLYTGMALFFVFSMYLMVFLVREGKYEPIPKAPRRTGSILDPVITYCRECYGIPFYYPFFITMALSDVSTICRTMYNIIYAQKVLDIPIADYGIIMGWGSALGLVLCVPLGYLCDRLNPLIIFGFGLFTVVLVNFFSYFYVTDYTSFYITSMLLAVVYTIQGVSTIPVFVTILPKELYGQFCSANALFRSIFMSIGGLGGGLLLDWTGNYQNIYMWDFLFTVAALGTFFLLYFNWQKRGGKTSYVAPERL